MPNQTICNICGANYEYKNGRWVCPACGAYKPEELSNEEVTLLYNASQKLRLADFDEAEKAYDDIVRKYPRNHAGYWGRLLSRYGIKYEDDFDGRKIPTCYATSMESILSDHDFLMACEYADKETQIYYQEQAAYMERVRTEWVNKAKKEKPYDIFICFKDSDLAGGISRTKDSVAAQELYIHLKEQGYRVFYSRESLRDKTGEKYEPYIFNALSTAKVMIVYGSSAEYVNSTWLKNEWMRYLKKMKAGEKKPGSLIVACDGFSPKELPTLLSQTQCLDAGQRSFFGDLDQAVQTSLKKEKPVMNSKKTGILLASCAVFLAVVLAITVPLLAKKNQGLLLTNEEYGISVSSDTDVIPNGAKLTVQAVTSGSVFDRASSALSGQASHLHVYDFSLRKGGKSVEPGNILTVSIPLPDDISADQAAVYYIRDTGDAEELDCTVSGSHIIFETTHFSLYVIGEKIISYTTVHFNAGGGIGSMEDLQIPVNTDATLPQCTFTKEGYEFLGWSAWENGSIQAVNGGTYRVGNESEYTLYAVWSIAGSEEECTVIFHANGGSGEMNNLCGIENSVITLSKCSMQREGYSFQGWAEKESDEIVAFDGGKYRLSTALIVHLYAIWSPNANTLKFDSNGGEGVMNPLTVKSDAETVLPVNLFTKAGYDFSGWATMPTGYAVYSGESLFQMGTKAEETLYAVWVPNQNTVIFNANGGKGMMQSLNIPTDSSANLPQCAFIKDGYTFAGWSLEKSGAVVYADQALLSMGADPSVTLLAAWMANINTLTLYANNGTTDSIEMNIATDASENLLKNTFEKPGYTFVGWSETENGEVQYQDEAEYMMGTASCGVYACWEADEHIIVFHANGGVGSMENQVIRTDATAKINACTFSKENCSFGGWSTTEDGAILYLDCAEYMMGVQPENNLYAVWVSIDEKGLAYAYNEADDTYTLVDLGTCLSTNVSVPSQYQGKNVAKIATNAFQKGSTIKSISVPETVMYIEEGAFYGCSSLESITLPFIGDMIRDEDCIYTENYLFGYVFGKKDYSNARQCTQRYDSHNSKNGLGYEEISYYIPISLQNIVILGGSAYPYSLCGQPAEKITFDENVKTIWHNALNGVKEIIVSNGVQEINNGAFIGCTRVREITIPFVGKTEGEISQFGRFFERTTYRGYRSQIQYNDNNSLYVIPDTLEVVNFSGEYLSQYAFSDCNIQVNFTGNLKTIDQGAFEDNTVLQSIDLPDTVERINDYAFYICKNLTEVKMSENIKWIGSNVFHGTVFFEQTTGLEDGCLYAGKALIKAVNPPSVCVVKSGTRCIAACAFSGTDVETVILPNGVITVGLWAFSGCHNLTKISLPDSLEEIVEGAFSGCDALLSILLLDNVLKIGKNAFYNCSALTIYCEASAKPSGWDKNWNASDCPVGWDYKSNYSQGLSYARVEGTVNTTKVYAYEVAGIGTCTDTVLRIPACVDGLPVLGILSNAFQDNLNITSVIFPEGADLAVADSEYGYDACRLFSASVLSDNHANSEILDEGNRFFIGSNAFSGCKNLMSVSLNGVSHIGESAFSGCSSLSAILISGQYIKAYAFRFCDNLTIYCSSADKGNWDYWWNASECPVVWNYN